MRRPIPKPQHQVKWPKGRVTIEQQHARAMGVLFVVRVGDTTVGQVERFEESHSIKIKGTRLSRGQSKPRPEWRLPGEPSWQGRSCGETIERILRAKGLI